MIDIIHKFQNLIYNLIDHSSFIKQHNIQVTIFTHASNNYPHILISDCNISAINLHVINQYKIDFNVNVFGKNDDLLALTQISNHIITLLNRDNLVNTDFTVINLKAHNFIQTQAHDLLTTKLTMNYRAVIR